MTRRYRLATAIVGIVALGCTRAEGGERGGGRKGAGSSRVEVGLRVPDYKALGLSGDSVALSGHVGHVVLLNIWATWCIPCRVEVPVVERLHQRYGPKGLDVIGVNVDAGNQTAKVEDFIKSFGVTFPVWRDTHSDILRIFRSPGVPATFVIDKDGMLLYKYLGPLPEGDANIHRVIEQGLAK